MAEKGAWIRLGERGSEQVAAGVRRVDGSMRQMGKTGSKAAAEMKRGFADVKSSVSGLYAAIGGVGIIAGTKAVMDYRKALGQLQADANLSNTEAEKLGATVLATASKFGVAKEELLAGIQVFQDFGGIVRPGMKIFEDLAKVHKATGTGMQELSTIAGTLIQTLGMTPEGAMKSIAQLTEQSIAGQVALRNLAGVVPEVMAGAQGYGFDGTRAVSQVGTLLQVAGQASGGKADVAKTQALALMRDLKKSAGDIKAKTKLDILDDSGKLKDIDWIMEQLGRRTGGLYQWKTVAKRGEKKGQASWFSPFTEESAKVAGVFGSMFDASTGTWKKGSTVTNVNAAKGDMDMDAYLQRRMHGVAEESEQVERGLKKADEKLQTYGAKAMSAIAANPGDAAFVGAAGYLGVKFLPALLRGKGAAGKAGELAGKAGAQGLPVYVTNMPSGGMGDAAGKAAAGAAGAAGKPTTVGGRGMRAVGWLSLITAGWEVAKEAMRSPEERKALTDSSRNNARSVLRNRAMELKAKGVTGDKLEAEMIMFRQMAMMTGQLGTRGNGESLLREILDELKNNKGTVTVKPADGLDRAKVEQGRGPKR